MNPTGSFEMSYDSYDLRTCLWIFWANRCEINQLWFGTAEARACYRVPIGAARASYGVAYSASMAVPILTSKVCRGMFKEKFTVWTTTDSFCWTSSIDLPQTRNNQFSQDQNGNKKIILEISAEILGCRGCRRLLQTARWSFWLVYCRLKWIKHTGLWQVSIDRCQILKLWSLLSSWTFSGFDDQRNHLSSEVWVKAHKAVAQKAVCWWVSMCRFVMDALVVVSHNSNYRALGHFVKHCP